MATAQRYAGVTQGLASVGDYMRNTPEREARMAEAKLRRERSKIELDEFVEQGPNRAAEADLKLAKMEGELYNMRTEALRNDTFNAFRAYNADKQPRHLNNFLKAAKSNPAGANMWGNWVRFDEVQRNQENEALLGQAGYTPEMIDRYFEDPSIADLVIGTDAQGRNSLINMNKLKVATGYARHANQQELADMKLQAQINSLNAGEMSADTNAINKLWEDEKRYNPDMPYKEAVQQYYDMKNSQRRTGSTVEREADRLQQDNPGMDRTTALHKAKTTLEGRTSSMKDVDAAQGIRDQLNNLNPEGDFYDLDLSDPKMRQRAGEHIVALEQLTGKKPTNEEKRVARQLRSLAKFSTTASAELTEDETGILDSMFHDVRKYFSDNVEGMAGTTAYHSFRNVMRNALMGATLTKSELQAFDQAAGTLGQQLGPVLAALKTSMSDVQTQMRSLTRDMDPMAAKYYLGSDLEQAEIAMDAIDERIRMISDKQELIKKGDSLTVKQAKPKVQVNIPVPATPDGSKPTISAAERFKQLQGGN